MVEGAGRIASLTTATKLGSAGPYVITGPDRIDTLVTDAGDDEVAVYRELGVEVVRA